MDESIPVSRQHRRHQRSTVVPIFPETNCSSQCGRLKRYIKSGSYP